MTLTRSMLLITFGFGAALSARAHITFNITANGLQETPPNASPATGTGTAEYDEATNSLTLNFSFAGLTGAEIAAHFHTAPPGTAGPVAIGLSTGSPKIGVFHLTDAQEAQLLAGNFYINVHTTAFGGGEIRGQLVEAPPQPCPGDADGDQDVDQDDLDLVLFNFGLAVPPGTNGDVDGDGDVDQDDLDQVLFSFGTTCH